MKKLLLGWLLVWIPGILIAQTITITDRKTGEPVELATLISENPRAFATSNANGETDISAFEDAEVIQIRSIGYKTITRSYSQLASGDHRLPMTPSNLNLDEVVVSATRWRQSTDDIPSQVVSVSSRQAGLLNPQTAADLLGISGRVFIQKSQQGGGSPMIRGFATNRLLYTVDGVRMNTAIFRGGNLQNVINLDPFATESAEVMFGPGSVIYGSDAIGGVMSFQTLEPQLALRDTTLVSGNAVARYATANQERTGHVDVRLGWKKWALVTSISSWDFGHVRQGTHGPDDYLKPYYVQRIDSTDRVVDQQDPLVQRPSSYSQKNIMQKIRYRPNAKLDVQYAFHYSETSPYGRYDRHNRMRDGAPRYAEWNYGPQKWMMNNLSLNHSGDYPFYDQLMLRLAYQRFEESRISRDLNKPARERRIEQVDAWSANLDFVKSIHSGNTLFYGLEAVLDDVTSLGSEENILTGTTLPGPSRYPESVWSSLALYISDEYKVREDLTLQGGVRYNQYLLKAQFDTTFYPFPFTSADINSGALTGSLGAVYRPGKDLVISLNLGTAFRSPNVDDVGKVFDSEPGSVVVPNPELQAEYAYNLDVGVARIFGDRVKVDLTAYYTWLENALVRRDYRLNGLDSIMYDGTMSRVQAIQNAAMARVYGVQAGFELKLPGKFDFSSELNMQRGYEEMENGLTSPSRHAAPVFGMSRLTYTTSRLNMKLYAVYQGERSHEDLAVSERDKVEIYALDANGNTYAPAWYTLNFKMAYKVTPRLTLNAGLENITDQRYRPYSSGISAPGRHFILSVKAGF